MVAGRIGDGDTVGTMVRMPAELRDRIKKSADAEGRSMNSEIVSALQEKYPALPTFSELAELIEQTADRLAEMEQTQEWFETAQALVSLIKSLEQKIPREGDPVSHPDTASPFEYTVKIPSPDADTRPKGAKDPSDTPPRK